MRANYKEALALETFNTSDVKYYVMYFTLFFFNKIALNFVLIFLSLASLIFIYFKFLN